MKEKFNPEKPDAVWCSDITYIWTYGGVVYLTSIMDLYSRKIIAWVLSDTLEAKYVVEAVEKARKRRHVEKPLVLHTDRGIQYVCKEYVKATCHSANYLEAFSPFYLDVLSGPNSVTVRLKGSDSAN